MGRVGIDRSGRGVGSGDRNGGVRWEGECG